MGNQNIPSLSGIATCAERGATKPLGLFVERGGGGAAAALLSTDLGSGDLTGVEGMLLGSPLETDGPRRRDAGVEGGFACEGEGEGEFEARETDRGGIASRVGVFWGVVIDDALGC